MPHTRVILLLGKCKRKVLQQAYPVPAFAFMRYHNPTELAKAQLWTPERILNYARGTEQRSKLALALIMKMR